MVHRRPGHRGQRGANVNPKMTTGEIEVEGHRRSPSSTGASPSPFPIEDEIDTAEEKRLAHRYLDLRRRPLQKTLITRSKMNAITRSLLVAERASSSSRRRSWASTRPAARATSWSPAG